MAETSNEELDALNARAQAIRRQEGELGEDERARHGPAIRLAHRRHIVVRAPSSSPGFRSGPQRDQRRGGDVDAGLGQATLRLTDGREGPFDKRLLDAAQIRLAYVSHPFPAQGQTTDTTHVIATALDRRGLLRRPDPRPRANSRLRLE